MRLSPPGAARQERAAKLRRDRAAALTLRATFPTLMQLRLEMQFQGTQNTPASQAHVLHPPARAFFEFPCPYADCDGHFNLSTAVNDALAKSQSEAGGILDCSGLRARDHSLKQPCQLQLVYRVIATY